MLPDPLHPAVVHFPIVLVTILPVLALVALYRIGRGHDARRSWFLPLVTSAALTVTGFVATRTGEAQEDRVEAVVAEAPIHSHEEAAEQFQLLAAGVLVLTAAGLLRGTAGRAFRWGAVAGSVVLLGAGIRVGHTGGELVYRHGAATAYLQSGAAPDQADHARRDRDRDRDEED